MLLSISKSHSPEDSVAPITTTGLVWLHHHPVTWPDYDEYCRMEKWVSELQITNDAAEGAVKNAQEVASTTRDQ